MVSECSGEFYGSVRMEAVDKICTNKMREAEAVFTRPRVGYRALNDPGD